MTRPPHRPPTATHAACWLAALLTIGAAPLTAPAQTLASKRQPQQQAQAGSYAGHEPAIQLAAELTAREGWEPDWARDWIAQAQRTPAVIRLVRPAPPGTPKNWAAYRDRFIEPRRIEAGQRFWSRHAAVLQRAEQTYGVPAWLIVGIIGVETLYGQHTGTYRALDALATLAFDFPAEHPRADQRRVFFRDELAALLKLSRSTGKPPTEWRGSFAGAMGLPQFMPSNWSRFGVDFDGDGRIDLIDSPADAIGSVARYLQGHGWRTDMPTHYAVRFDPASLDLDTLLAPDILPTFTPGAMQARGAHLPPEALGHTGPLALVELENGDPAQGGGPRTYVAGTENFYAITRYNQSSYYAMAVIELGRAVEAALKNPRSG
jgi:membrane-bound lytic murein transglycosylase B